MPDAGVTKHEISPRLSPSVAEESRRGLAKDTVAVAGLPGVKGAEKDLVTKLVNDINGVKSVKNRMTIE